MSLTNNLIVNKSNPLLGTILIPGDKSISHRSIILGSLTNGKLTINNFLRSDDCLATIQAMKSLGSDIEINDDKVHIKGNGLFSLTKSESIIDAGNSGTLIRLLTGLLAAQDFDSTLTGDDSLRQRPMGRIINPLVSCGAKIESNDDKAPIFIKSSPSLLPVNYTQNVASAQVKSGLMLFSLFINKESMFYEKVPTRDHTENLLEYLGYKIKRDQNSLSYKGGQSLVAKDIDIGSDISSASFFIIAALIIEGSCLEIPNVNINKYRTGVLNVLEEMGADIKLSNIHTASNEVVGDIKVKYSKLSSINIQGDIIPSLIDELPILFIACATASGTSIISGIEELRHKESDRLSAMEEGLRNVGIKVSSTNESIKITGGEIFGGKVSSYGDHRIAMSFAIAGLISKKSITIMNTKNIATSFPSFVNLLRELGVEIFEV